jgi:glycerol-1-phosphatase
VTVLRDPYDTLLLDLDGTLYKGPDAIPGAAQALASLPQRLIYVTNNASRSPLDVAKHLDELGFLADEEAVVASSQSAARVLSERLEAGSAVLVIGTDALANEIELVGLRPVRTADEKPVAVVQGHSTSTGWSNLAEACFAIRGGAIWVASNADTTLPTERGLAPGNGSMVAALRAATDQEPVIAGKPFVPIMEDALRRSGSRAALVVGDRMDTDIAGANAVGLDSLLVLTGVSTVDDFLRAVPAQRPTFVSFGLDSLNAEVAGDVTEWHAEFDGTDIVLSGAGDPISALTAVAAVSWTHPEFGAVRAEGDAAEGALRVWNESFERVTDGAVASRAPRTEIR